ncbi:MAG: SDR family NAD(P)-dependent oxidoreductase [Lachnospiraceae bacterium]
MKIALVTGASSGMGREAVIQIADRFGGLDEIWAIARRRDRLEQLEQELPVPLRILPLDLATDDALLVLAAELDDKQPDVKILVNSAGYGKIGKAGTLPLADVTGMVRLNCEALCALTHLVLPYMSVNSRIIQLASSAAFLPQPGFAIYAATKAFVLSYSRALHMELLPRNIAVTAVCPGPVKTEFFDIAETTGRIPLYKKLTMANPKKVVSLALRESMMGKTVSVYGFWIKAYQLLSKVVPHDLLLKIMTHL